MVTNDETVRCASIVAMPALVEHAQCYRGQGDDGDLNFAIVCRDCRMLPEDECPTATAPMTASAHGPTASRAAAVRTPG